jgi:hypothetical protein
MSIALKDQISNDPAFPNVGLTNSFLIINQKALLIIAVCWGIYIIVD